MYAKLIAFCYAYIVGLVLARVASVDPVLLPLLWGITAALVAAAAGWIGYQLLKARVGDRPPVRPSKLAWVWLVLAALSLGYTRYLDANTAPDSRLGDVVIEEGRAHYRALRAPPDTCRLRFVKTHPLERDVHLRVRGELDARVAVLDDTGRATLDSQGRWQFQLAPVVLASDVVVIRAADPIGTSVMLPQPFTRIESVDVLDGPDSGVIALLRVSNHIGSFARPGRRQAPVRILGRISADPLVYHFKTVLPITPEFVQVPAGGPFFRVEGGDIHVTVRPGMGGYEDLSRTAAYGRDVDVEGVLAVAGGAANPGGYNARRFLQNNNIYGLINLYAPREGPPPIRLIPPAEKASIPQGNPLVRFSLNLRDHILRVLKQTLLYPQSAFVGGATLGLRYGLQGVECMFSERYRQPDEAVTVGSTCEETIADEFKAAGINHVLAVSGLHVTIITVMFLGIFVLLRLPRQMYAPIIIFALVIFAIITGARPSTLRAVIMNSLMLLTWAYLGKGLRASALLGVPVAAFLILLHNPLVFTDPSFTLSFGAILSLALLTIPCLDLLQGLRGNRFGLFVLLVVFLTLLAIWRWPLVVTPQFLVPLAVLVVGLWMGAGWLQKKGRGLPNSFYYGRLPEGVGAFLAAQFAIQVGMMIPLSAHYFCRWPFAGAYANLIAIPLIGVIVQLGVIGGLLGLIPVIGLYLALILGAANWLFSSVFLWIGHAGAAWFPYPFARRPGLLFLGAYYLLCAAFIWRRPIAQWLTRIGQRLRLPARAVKSLALVVVLALVATAAVGLRPSRPTGARLTFLSVGYGSSVLVETPKGRRVLLDAGFIERELGRRNEATRTILPYLSYRGYRRLDALVLLSPRPERAAGAGHLLRHAWIREVIVPPALAGLTPDLSYDEFVARFAASDDKDDGEALLQRAYADLVFDPTRPREPTLARELARRRPTLMNRWAGWVTRQRTAAAGDILLEEQGPGGVFRIEVLRPARSDGPWEIDNSSLVLRVVYGETAVLLPADLDYRGITELAENLQPDQMQAQVCVLPHRGTAPADDGFSKPRIEEVLQDSLAPFLDRAQATWVVAEMGNPRPVLGRISRDAQRAHDLARRFVEERYGPSAWLSTDRDLAIQFDSDGHAWTLTTQAQLARGSGGEDVASDVAGGF